MLRGRFAVILGRLIDGDDIGAQLLLLGQQVHISLLERFGVLLLEFLVGLLGGFVDLAGGIDQCRKRLDLRRIVRIGRLVGAKMNDRPLHLPGRLRELGGGRRIRQ